MFFATAPNTLAARADVSICPGLKILFSSLLGHLLNWLFRNRKLHYGPQRVRQRDNQIMNNPRNYLIRASCLVGLFGVAGIWPAMISFRVFSVPAAGSLDHVAFFAVYLFPVSCAVGIVLAWLLYFAKQYRAAFVAIHLPGLNLALGGAAIGLQLLQDLPETLAGI